MRPRQLNFAFADSPQGGKGVDHSDVSEGKAHLLRLAECRTTRGRIAASNDRDELLEAVAWPPNLAVALLNVARNKGSAGVDGQSVDEVVNEARRLLPKLRRELMNGSYRPGDVRRVWIDKSGGGQRGLGIPNVIDRWVQQAVLQILEPIFESIFQPNSHGFRPNRGVHSAVAQAKEFVDAGFNVVADLDIAKFFDNVNHQRLLARVGQVVEDERILALINRMLKAGVVMPDGVRIMQKQGTPQGGPLSPLLSNVVLDELDVELQRRGLRYVRYADDCNIYVRSERAGHRVMESISRFLEKRLRLKLNLDKSGVRKPEDTHFLGFCFRKTEAGPWDVFASQRTKGRLAEKIRELTPRNFGQSLATCIEACDRYLRGWISAFWILTGEDSRRLLRDADAHIRRRMRAIIIKQKKRARYLFRYLVKRGARRESAARTAFSRRGVWYRSHTRAIERVHSPSWFAERLTSLEAEWTRLHLPPALASGQLLLFS